jgi:8-oxo-dGTP pyrophosphatase MutT (NUDIX family)
MTTEPPARPAPPALALLPPPRLRKWRRVRSTRVAQFRIMDISRIELEDGAGRDRGEVFVIECRDWCNVVALTPADELVLVWQYRFGTDSLSLELPGGVIDPGETPERAALRELREESGYEADALEPLLVVEPNPAMQNNRCHTFVARGARRTADVKFDAQEELETVLVPVSRLGALLDSGQVTHALIHGALMTFWRNLQR